MNITPIITNTYKLYIQTPKNPVKKENTSGGKSLLLDNPAARFLPFAGNVDLKQKPEYKTLSAEERKIVDAVIKFKTHDDSTQADIDLGNYYRQLKKVGFSTRESQRTCELIRNKDWQKKLRTNMSEKAVKEVAFLFRRPGDLKLAKIIAPKPFSSTQINSLKKVEKAIEKIYDRGIYLPQTRIPKASQLKPDGINCIEKNGIKIIRFAPDSDFEAIGFEKGTNMTKDRDNFFTLVKMRDIGMQNRVHNSYDPEAVFSFSYITPSNNNVFSHTDTIIHNDTKNRIGYFVDVDPMNIGAAYCSDLISGGGNAEKNYKYFENLFTDEKFPVNNFTNEGDSRSKPLTYFSDSYKEEMNNQGVNKNYSDVYKSLLKSQSVSDMSSDDSKFLKKVLFEKMWEPEEDDKLLDSDEVWSVLDYLETPSDDEWGENYDLHNEVICYIPKPNVTGLYNPTLSIDKLTKNHRDFVKKNDIPVFMNADKFDEMVKST